MDKNKRLCRTLWEAKEASETIIRAGKTMGIQTTGQLRDPADRILSLPTEAFAMLFLPEDMPGNERDAATDDFQLSSIFDIFWDRNKSRLRDVMGGGDR